MSKGEKLYVRKSSDLLSDTEDQMWDDSSMTAAYDKAVNKANAEIAKQIAMATNTKLGNNSKGNGKPNDKKEEKLNKKSGKSKAWKEGMPCRAVYVDDGLEYEANVTAILDNMECVVRFLGYENSEIVSLQSLKVSRGDQARLRQIEEATGVNLDDGFESQSNEETNASAPSTSHHSKKPNKKRQKAHLSEFPNLPNIPNISNMPNMPDVSRMMGGIPSFLLPSMPCPPPPPLTADEDDALSSMLISWYMAGYHAGLYQGMKRAKDNRRH